MSNIRKALITTIRAILIVLFSIIVTIFIYGIGIKLYTEVKLKIPIKASIPSCFPLYKNIFIGMRFNDLSKLMDLHQGNSGGYYSMTAKDSVPIKMGFGLVRDTYILQMIENTLFRGNKYLHQLYNYQIESISMSMYDNDKEYINKILLCNGNHYLICDHIISYNKINNKEINSVHWLHLWEKENIYVYLWITYNFRRNNIKLYYEEVFKNNLSQKKFRTHKEVPKDIKDKIILLLNEERNTFLQNRE